MISPALIATALLGGAPLVSGRPQATSQDLNQLQSIYNSVVAINPVLPVGSSPSNPDGQTDSPSTSWIGHLIDAPVLTTSTGTDPVDLHSSVAQLGTDQFQTSQLPPGLLAAYENPAAQPEIDQAATYLFASGDSNTVQGPSDIVPAANSQFVAQTLESPPNLEAPPILEAPIEVTKAVQASFRAILTDQCFFGIYVVSADDMNFELKKCGDSKDLNYLAQKLTAYKPCLGILKKKSQQGQMLSVLYYEKETDDVKLLKDGRGEFEADLHQATKYDVDRRNANDWATLTKTLSLSVQQNPPT